MTNSTAYRDGYVDQYLAYALDAYGGLELHISVRPETDLDSEFVAWDHDEQEWIKVNGWLFTFDNVDNEVTQ